MSDYEVVYYQPSGLNPIEVHSSIGSTGTNTHYPAPSLGDSGVSYSVESGPSASGPWTMVQTGITTKGVDLSSQPAGHAIWYRVYEVVNGTYSNPSAPIRIVTLDYTYVVATGGVGINHIAVSWLTTCANSYNLYKSVPAQDGLLQYMGTVSGLSFLDYAVSNDVTYCYVLRPLTNDGLVEGPDSNTACAYLSRSGVISMATSRATVYQRVQLGLETTPGTLVPATHIIPAIDLTSTPNRPIKTNRYPGTKGAISTQRGQEHTTSRFTSALDYNLLAYIFSSMFGIMTPALTGTKTQTWSWNPNSTDALVPSTFTIEQGGVKGAEKFGNGIFEGFTLRFSKEDAALEGSIFGTEYIRNITMTPGLPEVAPRPVDPIAIGVFISTDGGTTYTQLGDVIDGELMFNGLWEPSFRVSDLNKSFKKATEKQPEFGGTLTMEQGSESDAFIADLYAGQKIWIGIKSLGPLIEVIAGTPAVNSYNMLRFNQPVYVTRDEPGDKSNVWGTSIRFEGAHDALGLANISLVNQIASL